MNVRALKAASATAIAAGFAILIGRSYAYRWDDAYWYIQMAYGRTSQVVQPFAGRPLSPLVARGFHFLSGVNVNQSFEMTGLLAFLLFAAGIYALLDQARVDTTMLFAIALSSFWWITFSNYILPDILNDLLLLMFIVLLKKGKLVEAMLMLVPLSISRESSLLIAMCFALAAWKTVKLRTYAVGAVSLWGGLKLAKIIAGPTLSNKHNLGAAAYTLLKMPYNFAANLLGVTLWTNTLQKCTPAWHRHVTHMGAISEVGVCQFHPLQPVVVLSGWGCEFGLVGVAALLLIARWRELRHQPLYLRFCVVYGVVGLLLAPVLGSATDRLISYSWPLFLIAVPMLMQKRADATRTFYVPAAFATAASAMFFFGETHRSIALLLTGLAMALVSFLLLRRSAADVPDEIDAA